MHPKPKILAVCTGNVCRSPVIERLLAVALPQAKVSSAGTAAPVGTPIARSMKVQLYQAGANTSHVARQLTVEMIDQADLILTATAEHRSFVVAQQPTAVHRTFTLLEFAASTESANPTRLAGHTIPERLEILIRHARHARPKLRLADPDIPDPYLQPNEVYDAVFAQISEAVEVIAKALTNPDDTPKETLIRGSGALITSVR